MAKYICEYCGKEFNGWRSKKTKSYFCSKECKYAVNGWSESDLEILRNQYHNMDKSKISDLLSRPRSYGEIKRKAIEIGLTHSQHWEQKDIDYLIENYSKLPFKEIVAHFPDKNESSILAEARRFNLLGYRYLNRKYSDEDIAFLKKNYDVLSYDELAECLGRTVTAIKLRMIKLGLRKSTAIAGYETLINYVRSRLASWKRQMMIDNNFTCALTGKSHNVVIHHIYGFNLIFNEAIEKSGIPYYEDISMYSQKQLDDFFDVFMDIQSQHESICIDESVHKHFHSIFGYGNNTKEQWDEFVRTNYA